MHRPLSVFLLLGLLASCDPPEAPGPRHLLLISLDTTRVDHLGCYGEQRSMTPTIDRIAAEGIRFSDVTTTAPSTLSAHTSLMTGAWPQSHGVPRNGFVLSEGNVMLAELFRDAGFHTAAAIGSFALDARFRFDQGFDHFSQDFDLTVSQLREQDQRSGERVTEALLEHVDTVPGERLFLFAHYFDPHAPYEAPAEVARRFIADGKPLQSTFTHTLDAIRAHTRETLAHAARAGEPAQGLRTMIENAEGEPLGEDRWLADLYAAEVAHMDAAIGRLLVGLEERGLLEDMLIVIIGDHGETFWEHAGFWDHGMWVFQTTVQVPFILRFPDRAQAGTVVSEPISIIDLFPTLCRIFGMAMPRRCEGTDLGPVLHGERFDRGPIFSQATKPANPRAEPPGRWQNEGKARCVRKGQWKYVRALGLRMEQLFDLETDPDERNDLLAKPPLSPPASRALRELRVIMTEWEDSADPLSSEFDQEHFEDTARRLQDLGYSGR